MSLNFILFVFTVVVVGGAAAVHRDTLRETTIGAMTEATTETMIVMMKESTDLTGNFLYQQPFWRLVINLLNLNHFQNV